MQASVGTGDSSPTSVRTERAKELRHHLGHLDALRGLAVLGVILIHTGQAFPNSEYEYLNNPGMRGVQLFFVVSAFTLLLSSQRRVSEPKPTISFFLRRYFRLAPLYYPFIFLAYFTVPQLHDLGWLKTLPAFFFMHNFFPSAYYAGTYGGWSLGVEALFYICFPLLVRWIRDLRTAVLWLTAVGTVSTIIWVAASTIAPGQWAYWSYFSFTVEIPVFLMGFVAFYLWRDHMQNSVNPANAKWISAALLILTFTIFIDIVPINGMKTFFSSVFCGTLLLAVSLYPWRLLVNRVTIFLGKVSYSMYLIHGAIVWSLIPVLKVHYPVLEHHANRTIWCIVAYLIIVPTSALFGWGTWYFIEEPGIRLGRRVVRWVQGLPSSNQSLHAPARAAFEKSDSPDAQF